MDDSYKLRCTLLGHSMDVRGVACGETEGGKSFIVSGSRDRSSKIWMPMEEGPGFFQYQSCEGHTNFVSCVAVVPPNPKHPTGLVLTGGHDHTVLAFEMGKHLPVFRLVGHKGTVCSIVCTDNSLIITGSWDQTAKVWADKENIATLHAHAAAIWAVASLPGDGNRILTASADKEIHLWTDFKADKIFRGHTDCVRALAIKNSEQFFSASNDATIRLWSIPQAETMQIFYGHTNFIYSLSLQPNGEDIVSVGEDRTLRIWKGSACKQVIHLPAVSVWSVAVLKNGDVVTGSSDGTVRVFTNDTGRMASPEDLVAFDEEVSKSTIAAQQELGGMKISDLPGPEALLKEGKKDGDTKMIRDGDKVTCHSWSAAERKWNKVGDVVGASGATQNTSGKVLHEGKEYDYVFSVDLDDQKTLKLPYNITEDPWFAAQKFIDKNELSQLFLDQVANFIIKNTKGMQITATNDSNYADPFTGTGRYIPNGSGSGPSTSRGGVDPFTGSGAYVTSSASSQLPGPSSSGTCFPVQQFLQFSTVPNYDALKKKLGEFIQQLGDTAGISEADIDNVLSIGQSPKWNEQMKQYITCCLGWPLDKMFPVLDLMRLGVLDSEFATNLNQNIPLLDELSSRVISQNTGASQMLMLRLLCNVFGPLTNELMSHKSSLVSLILNNVSKGKLNQVAAATVFLNYSMVVCDPSNGEWSSIDAQTEILMAAVTMSEHVEEPEAIYRVLVCIGNILSGNPEMKELFKGLNADAAIKKFTEMQAVAKVKDCATQLMGCL